MAIIDNIVEVQIKRETAAVDMTSFDIPLILVNINADMANMFPEHVRTYTSLEGVIGDFGVGHKAVEIATKLLGGDLRPSTFKVGVKRHTESYAIALAACIEEDNNWYALLSDASDESDILALSEMIQGFRKIYLTSTNDSLALDTIQTPNFTTTVPVGNIESPVDGEEIVLKINGNIYKSVAVDDNGWDWGEFINVSSSESLGGDVTFNESSILIDLDSMFTVTGGSVRRADGNGGFVVSEISTDNLPKTVIGDMDIGQILFLKGLDRTIIQYSSTAFQDYPEAVWCGSQLPEIPGSNTWEYKQLPGVMVDRLTDSEITLLEGRGYNYYIPVKGVNITRRGKTSGMVWVDELILVDWLHARMQEQIFFRLVNRKKIPYTSSGFAVIESEVRSVLDQAVSNGGVDTYTVSVPHPLAIPENVRTQRILDHISFEARLAGGVSTVIIRGTVHS